MKIRLKHFKMKLDTMARYVKQLLEINLKLVVSQ